jgi:hypothetical protein
VPFRDDHDAALQRIEALEADLKQTKAERDQATRERDRLADDVAKLHSKAPEREIVVVATAPLTARERGDLIEALEDGARGYRERIWLVAGIGIATLIAALIAGLVTKIAVGLVLGLVPLLLVVVAALQLADVTEDRWRSVLAAIRDNPAKILTVRRTSDRYGWKLVVGTTNGELTMQGDSEVLELLARHCPTARFEG